MENDEPIESKFPEPSEQEKPKSGVVRKPDENQSRSSKALVNEWQDRIIRAKKHWDKAHKTMKQDMDFFMGKQWPYPTEHDERYVANIVQSHIKQKVASLYAKNPKAVAKRRKTMDFAIWGEESSELQAAQTQNQITIQQTGMPDPQAMALMEDVSQGMMKRANIEKVARTLEIIFHHILEDQDVKTQMKQLVRRTCVTGVGYVKLGYHRMMEKRPEDAEKITDATEELKTLERLMADRQDDIFDENSARAEQLKILLHELSEKEEHIVSEGLVFDFPQSQTIIVDPKCRQLQGFIGADWVAQEFILNVDEVKEIYNVDLGKTYTRHEDQVKKLHDGNDKGDECNLARVWEIYNKRDGMRYVMADGYPEFLEEPGCPEIKLKRFWPFFTLVFNEVENEREIYPPSDVRLLTPIQREYNLARQRLREHRNANRPLYVTPVGSLSESDVRKLIDRSPNEVIQLQAIQPGQKVSDVLQPVMPIPIDPSLYDVSMYMEDIYRVIGSQEANMGGTGTSTATEVSVAESSRQTAMGSNVDDLDEFLTELSKASGQILLTMMDPSTAQKIAGPGASWPTLTAQEIADNLMLEIQAGSSGRPNKAAEIANFERLAPTLLQIPGIDPSWMAKEAVRRMDDSIDLTDVIKGALPSIVAQNAAKENANLQAAQGNPPAEPAAPPAPVGHPMGGHAASPEEMAGGQMQPSNGELTP
jgi:hypothetical protein